MQRRDFSGEIIVALFAIGVIALALIFAVVLTISRDIGAPQATFTSTPARFATPQTTELVPTPTTEGATASPPDASPTVTALEATPSADSVTAAPVAGTVVATSTTPEITATPTPTETCPPGRVITEIPTQTASATSGPTQTPSVTRTPRPTRTLRPSVTPTETPTVTPSRTRPITGTPPTLTPGLTSSATIAPSATTASSPTTAPTSTRQATSAPAVVTLPPTNTAIPATPVPSTTTRTNTAAPTRTNTPTRTVTFTASPTATSTASATRTLTATPTFTATFTATNTPTGTFTPSRTPTYTPTRTNTPLPSPTLLIPTLAASFTPIASPTPPCTPRTDWVLYTVQAGDTLTRLSQRLGVSVADLQRGNCLPDTRLTAGQIIRIPRSLQATATPLGDTGGGVLPGINVSQCDNAAVRITSPAPGSTVSGVITFTGSALIPDFSFYKLEARAEGSGNWVTFITSPIPIENGVLGTLDTRAFGTGIFWVQILAVDNTSSYPIPPCAIRLNFANSG